MSRFLAEWLKALVRALIEKGNLVDLEGLRLLVVVSLFSLFRIEARGSFVTDFSQRGKALAEAHLS